MKRSEAIKEFLLERTHPDLAELYHAGMEVQVNVAQDGGDRCTFELENGYKYWAYTLPNGSRWAPFRIPRNAYSEPQGNDSDITFPLKAHVDAIGMTGWDWELRASRWVGFDFDSIIGHSEAHDCKLSAQEIAAVQKKASALDYVTVRRSTGGNGLHLYVFLEKPEPTANHNEHAALARAILNQMSFDAGFDFLSGADVCGGNLWVWARKMEATENGLELIKQGGTLAAAPDKWKANLGVIERRRTTGAVEMFEDDEEQESYDMTGRNRPRIKLDEEHKALIKFLQEETEFTTWYEQDEQRLITHTLALAAAHEKLGLRGIFKTDSSGSTDQNCFCYPLQRGGWVVRRYGTNVRETETWSKDPAGWTKCLFNMPPVLTDVSNLLGGIELPNGGFEYPNADALKEAARTLGVELEINPLAQKHKGNLVRQRDGRVIVEIDCDGMQDRIDMPGWAVQKKKWTKIIEVEVGQEEGIEIDKIDPFLRHVVTDDGNCFGWYYIPPGADKWIDLGKDNIRDALYDRGYKMADEIRGIMGACINNSWEVVSEPFQPEYPGGRKWNFKHVQLQYPLNPDRDNLHFPTWTIILNHVGHSLTKYIIQNEWCKQNNIRTGGDYLKLWCAWMFQYPKQRLPYLFFYSLQQHTGKTTFHEQLGKLMSPKGYVKAERALSDNFNGELLPAVLCAIEELDLTSNKNAYNRVKDYTTAQFISIRDLHKTQVQIANTTHWVQTANSLNFVPIEPGDSRIVVSLVHPLKQVISTHDLNTRCRKEATDFLTELFTMDLPTPPQGRMALPVIETDEKQRAEQAKESALDAFLREQCFYVPGEAMHYEDFESAFRASLDSPAERGAWSSKRIKREMPLERFPRGKYGKDQTIHYGNLSLEDKPVTDIRLVQVNNTLVRDTA